MKRGNSGWKPWFNAKGGQFQPQKAKPLYTFSKNSGNDPEDQQSTTNSSPAGSRTDAFFTTNVEPGSFIGWKLYFPEKSKYPGFYENNLKTILQNFNFQALMILLNLSFESEKWRTISKYSATGTILMRLWTNASSL